MLIPKYIKEKHPDIIKELISPDESHRFKYAVKFDPMSKSFSYDNKYFIQGYKLFDVHRAVYICSRLNKDGLSFKPGSVYIPDIALYPTFSTALGALGYNRAYPEECNVLYTLQMEFMIYASVITQLIRQDTAEKTTPKSTSGFPFWTIKTNKKGLLNRAELNLTGDDSTKITHLFILSDKGGPLS